MKKNEKPSAELTASIENIPALSHVTLGEAEADKICAEAKDQLREINAEGLGIVSMTNGVMMTVTALGAAAIMTGGAPLVAAPLLLLPCGLGAATGPLAAMFRDDACRSGERARSDAHKKLKSHFEKAQAEAYRQKQALLVAKADQHVKEGGLLTPEILSYLVAVPPESLAGVSSRLAITVLQARKMLRIVRGKEDAAAKVFTFARFRLNEPHREEHQELLLEKLRSADMDCEPDPVYPEPAMTEFADRTALENAKLGTAGIAARAVFSPLFYINDVIAIYRVRGMNLKKPEMEIAVPPLVRAEDFAACLEKYESEIEKLDLPALRGWGRAAKAIAAPRALLPRP